VSGVSGALPVDVLTVPGAPTVDCSPPSCTEYVLALSLPRRRTSGDLLVKAGTVGANLGISLRLVDTSGEVIATSSAIGDGVTTGGVQHGQYFRERSLATGRYRLQVLAIGGQADFTGSVQWSAG
jgi:hypothetical protein